MDDEQLTNGGKSMTSKVLRSATMCMIGMVLSAQAEASLIWNWSFSGAGVTAAGTFTTQDIPDGSGFHLITGITGERNGITILGLQQAGTAIPGNEPFGVDNLVRTNVPQLTLHGFGFALADGTYSNPFWADFTTPMSYLEFYSVPSVPSDSTELPIAFEAHIASDPAAVPEIDPAGMGSVLPVIGACLGLLERRRKRA